MQSSYNVIKNNSIKAAGLKPIQTSEEVAKVKPEDEETAKNHIDSYENLARNIIENARRKSEQIILKAYEQSKSIEEEARVNGEKIKKQAYESAYNEGYNKAYNEALQSAKTEGDSIINSAHELLNNAKQEYEDYFEKKTEELNNLILTIAKKVLYAEVKDKASINNMIYNALEGSKGSKNFIIRCNEIYVDELKNQIDTWKEQLGFFGDIFVLKDNCMEPGNAVIDKGNGKVVVGIEYALEKIEQILKEND